MPLKQNTKEEHRKKINQVVDYISCHLDDKLDLNKLSEISAISPFHFHRIMKAYLNEPIGSYIIRYRVETGAHLLIYGSQQIDDIAYKIGYDSPTSFTKAFKKHFGVSPTEFRNNKNIHTMETTIVNKVLPKGFTISPKITDRKIQKVIYVRLIGDYHSNDYGQAWEKIIKFMKSKHLFGFNQEYLGISVSNPNITESDKCQYDCCVTINKDVKPEGEIGVRNIEGGKYAVFNFKGSYDYFDAVYDAIYNNWLPESNFQLRDIPSFEKFVKHSKNPDKNKTEVYIPIE
jgi:AraC family transcriptional regulator